MNLIFRLIHILIFSRFRSKISLMDECSTPFRTWPTDLDVLMHMNNGVYLSLQDLARMDFMIRMGAATKISKQGWYPVVASEMIRFRRSLQVFQKFSIHTRLVSWDEKSIYLEHKFLSGGEIMAAGYIRARFLSKKGGTVSPQELLSLIGADVTPPPFPTSLSSWIAADNELQK
ncbi:acyl-CoA thioesterase [Bdellovibrio bacteriovorus]